MTDNTNNTAINPAETEAVVEKPKKVVVKAKRDSLILGILMLCVTILLALDFQVNTVNVESKRIWAYMLYGIFVLGTIGMIFLQPNANRLKYLFLLLTILQIVTLGALMYWNLGWWPILIIVNLFMAGGFFAAFTSFKRDVKMAK